MGRTSVVGLAVPWLVGTVCLHELPSLPSWRWYVPLAIVGVLAVGHPRARWMLWLVAGFAWAAYGAGQQLADRLPAPLSGTDFAITGWVDGFPSDAPGQVTFSLRVDRPAPPGMPRRVRLTWYRPPQEIAPGAALSLVARLRAPRGLRNPHGFDYEQWLFTERYGATGYVRSGEVRDDAHASVASKWLRLRAEIARRIDAAAPSRDASALLMALSIGERFGFSERHWADLRRTGTSHLVAISGMHVGLIASLVFVLARRFWLRLPSVVAVRDLEAAALASAAAAVGYAALAGFAIPAQRAVLMIVVALSMLVTRRAISAVNGLAAALLAVLLWDPLAPLAASFWLSFGAVGLLLLLSSERRVASRDELAGAAAIGSALARPLRALCRLQWGISLGLVPLVAVFFAEVSLIGPLVNLVAIPLFSFVLVPLTLLATLALALPDLGAVLMHGVGWLADYAWALIGAAAHAPWASMTLPHAAPFAIMAAVCGVLLGMPAHRLPGRRLAWLAILPLFIVQRQPLPEGGARLVVLDVGHGLAAFIDTRGHRLLYDAGPRYPSGFDIGREVVLPELARGRLDRLVVSHSDNDHAGGAAAVIGAFGALDVLKGPDVADLDGITCVAGQRWTWDGVDFEVLHPAPGFSWLGNESSCVLRVATAAGAILLTGDIEAHAERALSGEPALRADVVVVPHHGSATSSSAAFVASTSATLAVASAGYDNRWGFPKPEVRKRWEDAGAVMIVTGDCGAVTVELADDRFTLESERGKRRRYWQADAARCRDAAALLASRTADSDASDTENSRLSSW